MDKNIRVLILEDCVSDADLMEFELMEAGVQFISKRTTNENEFLRALEEFSPDLIICDYELPQYSGALALGEAKKRFPDVPFILVTDALNEEPEKIGKILAVGASDYVLKDHLDQLVPAIRGALG